MKLGRPTKLMPQDSRSRDDGKYAAVYKAVDRLKGNAWLPVTFDTKREAYNFSTTATTHRTRLLKTKIRGTTVYVRKVREKN